jgi:hypothetical protein
MNFKDDSFLSRVTAMISSMAALSLIVAGCASNPPPPNPPPAPPVAVAPPPQFVLNPDQMDRLCKADSDTCHRVQALQPLTLHDVKVMSTLGFSADVIIAQVRNSRTVFHLTASQIIDLKDSGVNNTVIDFLITTPNAIAGMSPVPEPMTNYNGVQTPPPPPPTEVQPPTPGPDYVWVDGDWVWNGGWVWVGGHWAYPPYPGAVWFHGGWRRGGWGGYRRYGGHWH